MAKVLFGNGIAGMRGKLGGMIFSANGSGAYVKTYARPSRLHTENQNNPILIVAYAGTWWNSLDQAERDDFDAFAADPCEIDFDPWGNQRFLSGFQWFTRCISRRWACGESDYEAVPHAPAQAAITGLALDILPPGEGNSYVSWDASQFGADLAAIVHISATSSASLQTQNKYSFQVLAKYDPDDEEEDITDALAYYFPFLAPGWRIFAKAWKQSIHGDRSPVAVTSATVQAP